MAFNITNLISHSIDLDFKQSSFCSIPVEQYDKDSAYIEAELFDGGSPYTIPVGSTASFGGTKPSSHIVLETATIENNKIYYKISEQCTVKEGDYPVKFTLYLPNGAVKYTQEFKIQVRKAVISSDAIADVDEVNVLNGLIVDASQSISGANIATENAIEATGLANIATTNAQNAADLANTKATLADEKAIQSNNAAILANEKAGLADLATSNANTATANTNTAITDAINATSNANTATINAQNAADYANDVANILDNETLKIFKPAVSTYTDLLTTYPTPENGWTVTVTNEVVSYRYNGTEWINLGIISSVDTATNTTLGIVKGGENIHVSIDGTMSVPKIGDLDQLQTISKTELVGAINEVNLRLTSMPNIFVGTDYPTPAEESLMKENDIWFIVSLNTDYLETFDGEMGAPPNSDRFIVETSSNGTAKLDGSGKLAITTSLTGAAMVISKENVYKNKCTRKVKVESLLSGAQVSTIFSISQKDTSPIPLPSAETTDERIIQCRFIADALSLLYHTEEGTVMQWDTVTNAWVISGATHLSTTINTQYVGILETTETQWRILIKDANEIISLVITDWVDWIATKDLGKKMWFWFGENISTGTSCQIKIDTYEQIVR